MWIETKKCGRCKTEKLAGEFYTKKISEDGRQSLFECYKFDLEIKWYETNRKVENIKKNNEYAIGST